MVLFGSQKVNTHTKEAELHPEFYHHAQIPIANGFHNGKIAFHIVLTPTRFRVRLGAKALVGQQLAPFECQFSVFLQLHILGVVEDRVGNDRFYSANELCLMSVKKSGHPGNIERSLCGLLPGDGLTHGCIITKCGFATNYAQCCFNFQQ